MHNIVTPRLLLRPWRNEDLEPYARMCADPEVMRYMSASGSPRTRAETREGIAKIENHWARLDFGLWAVEEKVSGKLIGRVGLQYQDTWPQGEHKTEVGWLIDCSYWGQGFATEGARESVHYGFEEIGLERIISIALPENIASRRVMEKCGLTFRGEAYWRDLYVVWYAIDRDEWEAGKPA